VKDDHVSDAEPCRDCPWLLANQQRRAHPDGWFTVRNRDWLWTRLRRGDPMSCHRTDPGNPVSQRAAERGYRPVPAGTQVKECRGAVVLQQREMHLLMNRYEMDVTVYRRARPRGLTRAGITAMVLRLAFGGVPILGAPRMGRPGLNAKVGHSPLPWDESCIKDIMQQTEDSQ
jgi:hypothetical protein